MNSGKKIPEIRFKEASQVLLECSSKVKNTITPAKKDFYEVMDVVSDNTDFNSSLISGSENGIVTDLIAKLCSYMCKEGQNSNEAKLILKELIILCSKLYGNYIVNEPKQPKILIENEELKNV